MALPVLGKTYTFTSVIAPSRKLNLYYPGSIANGQNVCLWTSDGSLEQQWKYSGSKLLNMRNTNYALDKYTVAGHSYNNNADVWTANDPTNQNIEFVSVSSDVVKIRLIDSGLYLTAANDANGTANGKTTESSGNVYWSNVNSTYQQWRFAEVGSSNEGIGNGTLVVGQRPSTLNYNSVPYQASFNRFHQDYSAGNGTAQCTWHCYGRAKEVLNKTITFLQSGGNHGGMWWARVNNCTKSQTPRANSIAVWSDGGYGHVAYVEKISGSTIYFTEANWDGNNTLNASDGIVKTMTASAMQTRGSSGQYSLLGYLYL